MAELKPADINAAPVRFLFFKHWKNQILRKSSGFKHMAPEIQVEKQFMIFFLAF